MGGGRVAGKRKLALRGLTLWSDKTCVIVPAGKPSGAKLQPAGCSTLTYDLAERGEGRTTADLRWTAQELHLLVQLNDSL